jgi:hypothetical protein
MTLPIPSACGDAKGTTTGHHRHRRADETACPECKAANAMYSAKNRAAKRRRGRHMSRNFEIY